jgi:hypothetical protein
MSSGCGTLVPSFAGSLFPLLPLPSLALALIVGVKVGVNVGVGVAVDAKTAKGVTARLSSTISSCSRRTTTWRAASSKSGARTAQTAPINNGAIASKPKLIKRDTGPIAILSITYMEKCKSRYRPVCYT